VQNGTEVEGAGRACGIAFPTESRGLDEVPRIVDNEWRYVERNASRECPLNLLVRVSLHNPNLGR